LAACSANSAARLDLRAIGALSSGKSEIFLKKVFGLRQLCTQTVVRDFAQPPSRQLLLLGGANF
jgi:hypothetical protein